MVLDRLFPQRETWLRQKMAQWPVRRFKWKKCDAKENLLDRSQLQALVEYQKSAAPGMLAEGQAEMLIGAAGEQC